MITQSQVKADLKKIGCKLKSQMNGDWAICEPKGNRVIVASLEEAQQYCIEKMRAMDVNSKKQVDAHTSIVAAHQSIDPNKTIELPIVSPPQSQVQSPVQSLSQAPINRSNKTTHSTRAAKPSAELNAAIKKADHIINLLKEKRLKMGMNVTLEDLKNNLLVKVCSNDLLDDVVRHVEAQLDKDCLNKVLVKRPFKNYLGSNDVMYFDIRYAVFLAKVE